MHKQRLELDWVGKNDEIKLEPRILLKSEANSRGAKNSGNLLIHGDNLLALKALEQDYEGRIQCIAIDPPYNTGSAFTHYDDGIEHSLWLSLMKARLEILKRLLRPDGTIWISIDDNEAHYLKVLCDEIFERRNFIANVLWQKRTSPEARLKLGAAHDHILVYGRNADLAKIKKAPIDPEVLKEAKNPDNDPRGAWSSTDFTAQGYRPNQMYKITTPAGVTYDPPEGRCWSNVESEFKKLLADNRMWFGKDGKSRPRVKNFLEESDGISAWTWWSNKEVGHNQEAKKESIALFGAAKAFATPKPERLMKRILELATDEGDIVLDSFAGSGTTGAVAHKMQRKWIMVEFGEQCQTHILPRMEKVISGEDAGGVSEAVGWQGGGGFDFVELAPSLLQKDVHGNWIISPKYDAIQLAEAVCKHEGFKFWPDQNLYWKQGYSTEKDFIFVTTEFLTADRIERIAASMKPDETLLICAKAFRVPANKYPNITIKKIPQMLLGRCEFGRDDYSLNVKEPVQEEMGLDEADI